MDTLVDTAYDTAEQEALNDIKEHALLRLGDGLFSIEVRSVREFLEPTQYSEIPKSPPHVLGLINIRSQNIAVIDLSMKLGMPEIEPDLSSRIVVLEMLKSNGDVSVIGCLTDGVVDVSILEPDQTEDMPELGGGFEPEFIKFLARYKDETVIVLDVEKILLNESLTI